MGTVYSWDLGFDWNATTDPSLGTNLYYLDNGFVNVTNGTPAAPVNLQNGDTVRFVIYDITPGASSTGPSNYQIASGSVINFRSAEANQTQSSPFSVSSISIPTGSSNVTYTSSDFQTSCPAWSNTTSQQISVSSGRYLMSVTLNVTDGTTTKTYSLDPEMIVGSAG